MEVTELLDLIAGGESSRVQFKENITNVTKIAQELVAFSNAKGGRIIIGVKDKTGEITGLDYLNIQRINSLLATAANEHVKSAVFIDTETVSVDDKKVIVVEVPEGTDKPYMDKNGLIFMKNGSDKRKVTSKEELARMLQSAGNLYAEERLVPKSSIQDIDWSAFAAFYEKRLGEEPEQSRLPQYIEQFNLGEAGKLNTAGLLLFGDTSKSRYLLPQFYVLAIWVAGNELPDRGFLLSEEAFYGTLRQQYRGAFDFMRSKINYILDGESFNSPTKPEIPFLVFEEVLTNALIHRNYFINDSIKVFIFRDRIEVRSPGALPNSLTISQLKVGVSKVRNPIISSFGRDLLNYKQAGSGIPRALRLYPYIDFVNEPELERFTVIIRRQEPTPGV